MIRVTARLRRNPEHAMKSLPKIELHLHLDGALRTETIMDLAREQNHELPAVTPEGLERYVHVSPECRSLTEYLAVFNIYYDLLKKPAALERIAGELCEDLARDGVVYAETRFAPVLNIHSEEQVQGRSREAMEERVRAVLRGLARGTRSGGTPAGLILCCYRGFDVRFAVETVEIARDLNREAKANGQDPLIAGVDLAGDESRWPAEAFRPAFELAMDAGIPRTVHAGEAAGADSVRAALEILGANRIGHGVRLKEDPELLERVREERIPLEVCLTSNLQTSTVPSLEAHPFGEYLRGGLRVTINTDNTGVSNIDLDHEWDIAREAYGLTQEEERAILTHSAEAAFTTDETRAGLHRRIEEYFQ